jgi:hypothetical protein
MNDLFDERCSTHSTNPINSRKFDTRRTIITAICVASLVLAGCGKESVTERPENVQASENETNTMDREVYRSESIEQDVIKAYEKLGAKYGRFNALECGRITFSDGENAANEGLPGFHFNSMLQVGRLPSLPIVNVPFGISFGFGLRVNEVPNELLKELNELKNLTCLDLSFTNLNNAGLKELKDLKNLRWLYLAKTNVSDEGLKELRSLKKGSSD